MGERTVAQEALFYSFSLERHVPADHLLRSIDRFVDLSGIALTHTSSGPKRWASGSRIAEHRRSVHESSCRSWRPRSATPALGTRYQVNIA
jgi:hypothetical protein